jgi:hypothetical protein
VVVVVVDGVVETDALEAGAFGVGCGGVWWSLLCLRRNLDLRVMVGIEESDVRAASPTTVMLTFVCSRLVDSRGRTVALGGSVQEGR